MKPYYLLTTLESPELSQVGGKGLSLIQMTSAGFQVPPGFVLTTNFFDPWIWQIKCTSEWLAVTSNLGGNLSASCEALKTHARGLILDDWQREVLSEAVGQLKMVSSILSFAVRSSSPEEDLGSASFAGGYETSLGVKGDELVPAIRRSFASCFDERVILYKKQQGFDVEGSQIAVVVQQLIPSEVSGVAFSLNPMNNCYDEVVINANYGLGETVVSGLVSVDEFVVDKVSRDVIQQKTGHKDTSIWAEPLGGIVEAPSEHRDQFCLDREQILAITDLVSRVENFYGKPIDIEWAYLDRNLYLLQARPITAYIPLPEGMLTPPREPRQLYIDYTLAKQGISYPLSVMGSEYWARIQNAMLGDKSDSLSEINNRLMFTIGGRFYANLSYTLKLQSKAQTASQISIQDTLSAEIIAQVPDDYIPERIPAGIKGQVLKAALARLNSVKFALKALWNPHKYQKYIRVETKAFENDLALEKSRGLPPGELANRLIERFSQYMGEVSLPATIAAEIARARIKKLITLNAPEHRDKIIYLERALPNNVTVEMGLGLYALACWDEIKDCNSAGEFVDRIQRRAFSPGFLHAWDDFIQRYGHRGSRDLDIAAPRYHEIPGEIYTQLKAMSVNTHPEVNPQAIYDRSVEERRRTYELVHKTIRVKSARAARQFDKFYQILTTLDGYREIHKFYIVKVADILRSTFLGVGDELVKLGRLDRREQVFDFTITELEAALSDPSVNLRALSDENTRFLRKIQHIRSFPRIIDSRGKILHAPRKESREGEMLGNAISPGLVSGTVKILHNPEEKPLQPGEILVARATDPGWTPLFLNAAGIILEVGGMLQHGALVAREYGKPCVAGIENVVELLTDGQVVELDGTQGIVRLKGMGKMQ